MNKDAQWLTPNDIHLKPSSPAAGTDEDTVLMLLTSRSNDQRQQIKAAYKKAYGKVRRREGAERAADSRQLNWRMAAGSRQPLVSIHSALLHLS